MSSKHTPDTTTLTQCEQTASGKGSARCLTKQACWTHLHRVSILAAGGGALLRASCAEEKTVRKEVMKRKGEKEGDGIGGERVREASPLRVPKSRQGGASDDERISMDG